MANWWDKYETAPEPAKAAAPKTAGNWWDKYEQADSATSRRGNRTPETSEQAYARRQAEATGAAPSEEDGYQWARDIRDAVGRGVGALGESSVQSAGTAVDAAADGRNFMQRGLSHWSGQEPNIIEPNAGLAANEFAQDLRRSKDAIFPESSAAARLGEDLNAAEGFVESVGAYVANPVGTAHKAVEMLTSSVPAIRALGAVGGGAVLAGGGAGVDAGNQFDAEFAAIRETPEFKALAAEHGQERAREILKAQRINRVTAAAGTAGGLLAGATRGLGLNPADDIIAGKAAQQGALSTIVREGAGEIPEEVGTQIATNLASGKPWNDQLGETAAGGLVLGSAAAAPVAATTIPGNVRNVRNLRETVRQANSFGDIDRRNTIDFTPDRAKEIASRILPAADPDVTSGADLATAAFRSAGVGAQPEDAALDSLLAGVELPQQREGGDGRETDRLGQREDGPPGTAIGGPVPVGPIGRDQSAVRSSMEGRGASRFDDGVLREADVVPPGLLTASKPRLVELPDGSLFVPGNPADLRARIAAVGLPADGGMARTMDGVEGVRFPKQWRAQIEGVLGVEGMGSGSTTGGVPAVYSGRGNSAEQVPGGPAASDGAVDTHDGSRINSRPAYPADGAAQAQPTQAEASVGGRSSVSGISAGRSGPDVGLAGVGIPRGQDSGRDGNEPALPLPDGNGGGLDQAGPLRPGVALPDGAGAVGREDRSAQIPTASEQTVAPALRGLTTTELDHFASLRQEILDATAEQSGRAIVGDDGSVVGRQKWAQLHPDHSGFWRGRTSKIPAAKAIRALEKAANGEELTRAETNFIEYAKGWARTYAESQTTDENKSWSDAKVDQRETQRAAEVEASLPSSTDTSPQQRASATSLGADYTARLLELKADRGAWGLNPAEEAEYMDLLERDRETGKVAGRPIPGVGNKVAYADAVETGKVKPVVAFADLDNFKAINDKFGHRTGDDIIRAFGEVLAAEFPAATWHRGGDEFLTDGMTDAEVSERMERVRGVMSGVRLEVPLKDGSLGILEGVQFSYGTGANEEAADANLKRDKERRRDQGLRYDRAESDARRVDAGADRRGNARPEQDAGGTGARRDAAEEVSDALAGSDGGRSASGRTDAAPAYPGGRGEAVSTVERAALTASDARAEISADGPAEPPRPVDEQPRDEQGRFTTSTKNAVSEAEREAAGKNPVLKAAVKTNEETLAEAKARLAAKPSLADEIIERLSIVDVSSISHSDEAVLLVAKVQLMNKRNDAAKRASDTSKSSDPEFGELEMEIQRRNAKAEFEEIEAKLNAMDQATNASGREWGRMGQFRQRLMREDFTLVALERKKRVQEGRPLTVEEHNELKAQAAKFAELTERYEQTKKELEEARANSGAAASYENLVREMARQLRGDQRRKRPLLETLRKAADESRAALRAPSQINKKQGGAVDVAAFYHLARIGAFHVAEIGVKFADWTADVTADWTRRMKAELGSRIWRQHEAAMPDVLKAAHLQIEAATKDADDSRPSKASIVEGAEAPTHAIVYALAQANVLAGVHGEGPVMKAVTADLQAKFKDITERDVRRLFSEYGEAKFPSRQADKVELRELRALVSMQESIDRIAEGLPALKSGPQRDKMTQAVRERRVQLNERLKALEAKSGADPEKLASYQDARIANLKHQIEDLDKQLKTGERPERKPPPEPTAEMKRLIDERDALREKIIEADRGNPRETEKYLRQREAELQKQILALRDRIAAGAPPKAKPEAKPTDPKVEALEAARDALSAELKAIEKARKPVRDPEERYQTTRGRAIAREIEKIEARMAAGDYERSVKPLPRELNEKNTQAAFELQKAKYEYARRQFMLEMAKRSPLSKILGTAGEAFNLARSLMTSLDFSAVLRQGGFIAYGHPVRAARSIMPMLRAFASQQAAFAVDAEIKARPNARLYQQAKLELTESNSYDLTKMEEVFMSRWLEKSERIPGQAVRNAARSVKNVVLAPIRGSGRAYVTFMNKLRADSFDAMLAALARSEKPSLAEAEAVASYINVATGRGKIGRAKNAAAGLNTIFFAPRLVASRFNLLAGQPLYGGTNRTRFMIAKEYARFVMGVGVVYALAALAQDDDDPAIGLDPRSTDFGKIRFGNTRLDPWAGLQQVTVFLARSVTGESVAVTGRETIFRGEDKAYSPPDVLKNFIRSKLAPVPGSLANLYYGENMIGEPATVGSEALNLVTPMSAGTIKDVMVEHGVAEGTAISLLSIFGMGVNNFDPDKKNN